MLFEDTAAMLGLVVAMIGIALAEYLAIPELDGAASIVIAFILAATAALLAYESKGLLIGEATHPEIRTHIQAILQSERHIAGTNEFLTMHLGPQDVLLNLSLDFKDELSSEEVELVISELELKIKREFPEIKRIFIEAQCWLAHRRDKRRPGTAGDQTDG